MSKSAEFISGLIAKPPNENAPNYVIAKISIKRQELIAWLKTKGDDWINAEIKVSQNGKWYIAVDNWKPDRVAHKSGPEILNDQRDELQGNNPPRDELGRDQTPDFDDDDIPF